MTNSYTISILDFLIHRQPHGSSFHFSNKLSMLIFSELQGLTSTLGSWLQTPLKRKLLESLEKTDATIPWYGTNAHQFSNQVWPPNQYQNQPAWSTCLMGQDWKVYPRWWHGSQVPNGSSCVTCHQSDFWIGWKMKPDVSFWRTILADIKRQLESYHHQHRQSWQCPSRWWTTSMSLEMQKQQKRQEPWVTCLIALYFLLQVGEYTQDQQNACLYTLFLILESSCSFRLKRCQLVLSVIVALAFNTVGFHGDDCQVSPVRSLKALVRS